MVKKFFKKFKKKLLSYDKKILVAGALFVLLIAGTAITFARTGSFNIFADSANTLRVRVSYNGSSAPGAYVSGEFGSTNADGSGDATFYNIPFGTYSYTAIYGGCSKDDSVVVNSSNEYDSVSLNCQGPNPNPSPSQYANPSVTYSTNPFCGTNGVLCPDPRPSASVSAVHNNKFSLTADGKVFDGGTAKQLDGVSVTISYPASITLKSTTTQNSGDFLLQDIELKTWVPANYIMTFSKSGYTTQTINLNTLMPAVTSLGPGGGLFAISQTVTMRAGASSSVTVYGNSQDLEFQGKVTASSSPVAGGQIGVWCRENPCTSANIADANTFSVSTFTTTNGLQQNYKGSYGYNPARSGSQVTRLSAVFRAPSGYTLSDGTKEQYFYINASDIQRPISGSGKSFFTKDFALIYNPSAYVSPSPSPSPKPSPSPSLSPSPNPIAQCLSVDPNLQSEAQALLQQLSGIDTTEFISLDPSQIDIAAELLGDNDNAMRARFIDLISKRGSLNTVEVGNFLADYLGKQTSLSPEALNLLRNIEQPTFDTYLKAHRTEVTAAIYSINRTDSKLAIVLTDIVNDTVINGFNKDRTAQKIAAYLDAKYNLGSEAVKLITAVQGVDFGKYVAKDPAKARQVVDYIRQKDPELADRLEILFRKSTIRLSDILNVVNGSRSSAVNQTQSNLANINVQLTSSEWLRYQRVALANNGTIPQSEMQSVFGEALRRALLKAGSPLIKYEVSRLAAMLLRDPATFKTVVSMLEHTDVSVNLINQLINDGTITVSATAQPTYLGGKVGAVLSLNGTLSTGKFITQATASYSTCDDGSGEISGSSAGRLKGSLTVKPRNGKWTGSVNIDARGVFGEFTFPLGRD